MLAEMGNKWKVKNARRFIHGTEQGRANPSGLAKQGMQDKIQNRRIYWTRWTTSSF